MTHPSGANLRVLVVHNTYQQRGGEEAVVEAEMSLLRERGHAVEIYLRHNDELRDMGALTAARNAVWSSQTGADLRRMIAGFRPDVIHAHNTFALISPSMYSAAAATGVPVVQTLHNYRLLCLQAMFLREGRVCEDCLGRFPWRGVVHRCYRRSAPQSAVLAAMIGLHRAVGTFQKLVSRYIALSEFSRAKFIAGGLPGERIIVKPAFASLPLFGAAGARSGALFVGRLSPEKGTDVLARAAAIRLPSVVEVIGSGPEQASLEHAAGIRLLGWQTPEAVYSKMREAAFLVVPSICYETFGVAVMEAFGSGLPVIASRLGALAEIVRDGETGLLFEAGNAPELAQKMAWAEAHPGEMTRMGDTARREYESKYTPDLNYQALLSVYQAAVSCRQ